MCGVCVNIFYPLFTRKVPMFGLEAVFRNGVPVGHLRRSDYGFFIDKTIGYGYIRNPDGGVVRALNTHCTLSHCRGAHLTYGTSACTRCCW